MRPSAVDPAETSKKTFGFDILVADCSVDAVVNDNNKELVFFCYNDTTNTNGNNDDNIDDGEDVEKGMEECDRIRELCEHVSPFRRFSQRETLSGGRTV